MNWAMSPENPASSSSTQTNFGLDAREPREASKVQGLDGNVEMGQRSKDYPF